MRSESWGGGMYGGADACVATRVEEAVVDTHVGGFGVVLRGGYQGAISRV